MNIYSKSLDLLGRQLTNPSYAKNNISEFDIQPPVGNWVSPVGFIVPNTRRFEWAIKQHGKDVTLENIWGKSVEAWYIANTVKSSKLQKHIIMQCLILYKFQTYPFLIKSIDDRGGLEFLKTCDHIIPRNSTRTGNWEGVGLKSNFIKILCNCYCIIKNCECDGVFMTQKDLF